jgi:hypothetical protein
MTSAPAVGFKKAPIFRTQRQIRRELRRHGAPLRTMVLRAPLPSLQDRERDMYDNGLAGFERVLLMLVEHMDVVSLVIGRDAQNEKNHFGVKVETMAEALSMSARTVERHLRTIHALGLVQSKTRAEQITEGRWIGRTAVRYFSKAFFAVIGLARYIERKRSTEYQHRKVGREGRHLAARELQHTGWMFVKSRPARAVRSLAALFRPPDPEPKPG